LVNFDLEKKNQLMTKLFAKKPNFSSKLKYIYKIYKERSKKYEKFKDEKYTNLFHNFIL